MYSLSATLGLWLICTVTDGGCHIAYLPGAATHSSWDGIYATICGSDGTICEGLGTALGRIFSRCMIDLRASMAGLGSSRVATPIGEGTLLCILD